MFIAIECRCGFVASATSTLAAEDAHTAHVLYMNFDDPTHPQGVHSERSSIVQARPPKRK
jgi:hypothetical protein